MPSQRHPVAERRRASVTVVLVDDEPLIRSALAQTLSAAGFELVGEAATGEDAIELVLDLRPDVVLMDIKLPDISGVQAIERLCLLAPASRVLVPYGNWGEPPIVELQQNSMVGFVCESEMSGIALLGRLDLLIPRSYAPRSGFIIGRVWADPSFMRLDNATNESFLSEQARGAPIEELLAAP
jgi:DNA-binding NarL/FixJ family response regulator